MKAWIVTDKNCDGYTCIIYAETRGKAIVSAIEHTEGAFDDYEFTEIWARRAPNLDQYYYGKSVLEWDNEEDWQLMVREAGFYCSYDMVDGDLECELCLANAWCSRYKERTKEEAERAGKGRD